MTPFSPPLSKTIPPDCVTTAWARDSGLATAFVGNFDKIRKRRRRLGHRIYHSALGGPEAHLELSSSHTCPACQGGQLRNFRPLTRGIQEALKEIANPLRLFLVFEDLYYGMGLKLPNFSPQFECSSCLANIAICFKCDKPWKLARPLTNRERVTCPNCSTEMYYSMG